MQGIKYLELNAYSVLIILVVLLKNLNGLTEEKAEKPPAFLVLRGRFTLQI